MKRISYKSFVAILVIGAASLHNNVQAADSFCDFLNNTLGQGVKSLTEIAGNFEIPDHVKTMASSIVSQVDAVVQAISVSAGNVSEATRKQIEDMKRQWLVMDRNTKILIIGGIIVAIIGAITYQFAGTTAAPVQPIPVIPVMTPPAVQPQPTIKPVTTTPSSYNDQLQESVTHQLEDFDFGL